MVMSGTWVCMDMHGYIYLYARMRLNMNGYAWIWMNMHAYAHGMHDHVWNCMGRHGYAWIGMNGIMVPKPYRPRMDAPQKDWAP